MNYSIRAAVIEDIPQMLANTVKFLQATPYKYLEFVPGDMQEELLAMMNSNLCFIAEADGVHLGGVGAVISPLFINNKILIAAERFWWVDPDSRDTGVGKSLFVAIYTAAKTVGCDYLTMFSLADPAVDKLYERAGMVKTDHTWMAKL